MIRPIVLTVLIATTAAGVDYEAARDLQKQTRGTVSNEQLIPSWAPDGSALYFRRGSGILRVDTQSGKSSSAIDPGELEKWFEGIKLNIQRFEIAEDGEIVCLVTAGNTVRVLRVSEDSSEEVDGFALAPQVASANTKSVNGGKASLIAFINDTASPTDIFWADASKTKKKYATLQPGGTFIQNTFAGHVFIAGDLAFTATEKPAIARLSTSAQKKPIVSVTDKPKVTFQNHNLFIDQVQLTTDGVADWSYRGPLHGSPCGRYLIVQREKKGSNRHIDLIHSTPTGQFHPKTESIPYAKPGDILNTRKPHLFDLRSESEIPLDDALFSNPWNLTEYHWSPDGERLYFVYNERGHQTLRLLAVETATAKVVTVIEETSSTFIDYSQKTYLHHLDQSDQVLWMSERNGWNHLYLADRKTGNIQPVTSGKWVVRGIDHVDEDARRIWLRVSGVHPGEDPYHIHYACVDFDGSRFTLLTEGNGTHEVQFSNDRKFLTDTWSRVDRPPVHELRRAADGKKLADLGEADASKLLAIHPYLPEPFVSKGRDGITDIHGVLFRPSHFDPLQKYPVIEAIYAGPHGYYVPKAFKAYHGHQRLAELGFIVVQIDGMGTNWRSKKFHDVCWKNLKDAGLPDRIAWMKAAAQKYPYMDLSRVGIYGGSAGGQSAMRAVLDHADFYKAAAADCGCHDNRVDKIWWNEAWMGWPVDESYVKSSNVVDAHKLGGKLLLTVGMLDRNVDPASTMQVVEALIKANKDFEFIPFPTKGHGAGGSPYGIQKREEFFVRHLLNTSGNDN